MAKSSFKKEDAEKNNVGVVCPYCGESGNKPIMKRWHFDKCKFNPVNLISSILSPAQLAKVSLDRFTSDKTDDPDYCDFIPGSYSWHSVMADRGVEPQASISRQLIKKG